MLLSPMSLIGQAMQLTRLDLRPHRRRPSLGRCAVGIILGVALSLFVNWLIVGAAEALFPSTRGFPHFQFEDYARLTVVGAFIACLGWPVLTRVSSSPLFVYLWIAVLGTLILWLPDVYILVVLHEPAPAVAVLAVMHLVVPLASVLTMISVAPMPRSRRY